MSLGDLLSVLISKDVDKTFSDTSKVSTCNKYVMHINTKGTISAGNISNTLF